MRPFLAIALFSLLFALTAYADKGVPRIDLDNGVALTGNGQAIRTNPAALPDFKRSLADVAVYDSFDLGVRGQLSTNLVENVGVGVAFDHIAGQSIVTPGFGFTTGKISLGVSTTVFPSSMAFDDFTIGFRWDKSDDFSFAIVCYDVPHLRNFTVGLGLLRSQKWKVELDANLYFENSSLDLETAEARVAVSYLPASSVWLMARLMVPVIPQIQFDKHNIELGLHVWFTSNTAIYVLYQNPLSKVVAGIKIKI